MIRLLDQNASCLLNIPGVFGATIEGLSLEGRKLGKNVHGILLNKENDGEREDTFRIERSRSASFSRDQEWW